MQVARRKTDETAPATLLTRLFFTQENDDGGFYY